MSDPKQIAKIAKETSKNMSPVKRYNNWDVLAKLKSVEDFVPICLECAQQVGRYEMPMKDAEKIINLLMNIDKLSTNRFQKFTIEKISLIENIYNKIEQTIDVSIESEEN